MRIKCLIIDDEPLAINVIKNYLEPLENFEVVNTFSNPIEGLNFLKNNKVDVIFLDINMPVLDGINFIKSLENPPLLVITSAYSQFAIETYELDVLDYLVKPIEFPRLMKTLNKISKRLENKASSPQESNPDSPFIFVKIDKKRMKKIFFNEILVIESLKDYLKINTTTGKYIIHSTLSDFTDLLPEKNFLRIHRSYTIAIDKIDAVEGNSIEIEGLRYVIGRSYIDHVKQRILNSSI
ncbi:LytR/AlgR family response regulator transcription factor [Flavobacterium johnsoniae]|uniref:Two component transcriptional regulator, LytTR family n=1 Tax=Flavobacterium johnsoniae (strain ATCC 17061 / DSM 2064 / JCM 8514 / BCRC 14874 / CCUG 350202 / NBRC 14942 / NCIMB 11054 / UW101) TaxID=376686 RepID=A5FIA9_FLAJ1|nr:LytTR family DNA-binding domain-containing protein [Flavobacterium johnsoniae]ABQ05061.1 two component transcriptional regulator, LytTR family [Flavobacterium johnsoniae UW101]OXG00364.1 DNA-binding response regulator [Flavobacterium johnsoniae UW101]WQG83139.1 LytTR family DNA-binding domain-containing protein [Flavobacterium johnsoniae UW101]SHL90383.1 two component transcriptional regulator, LytTR family [Flavobacterium johnsoniae]